jgi:hypothetical protein
VGEIKPVASFDSAGRPCERKQIIQLRSNVDVYFELRKVGDFAAAPAGTEAQFKRLIVKVRTKVRQYEKQYSPVWSASRL